MRRVVVTGLGTVNPIGNNVKDTWEAAMAGKCGIGLITHYDTEGRKVKLAAEVKDFHPEEVLDKGSIRKMDEFTVFGVCAALEAVRDSALDLQQENTERCGIIFSSGIGGIGTIEKEEQRGQQKGFDRVSPHFIPMSIGNMAAGTIAIRCGFHGMVSDVVSACAGGTNAIGDAFRQIKDGYQDIMIAGGAEAAITELSIGGFTAMRALCTAEDPSRASIPFDKERSGFVMGEGAGALVLEEYEHAKKRGAKIYCEVAGYGSTCDAYHVTAPLEDGREAARAMKLAMEEAGVEPSQMNYINAHGTSTSLNDRGETLAVKAAFGEAARQIPMSSTKSMTGHLLGASGAVEGILTALCVAEDVILPTINYQVPDENCDLDIVPNTMRKGTVACAMSNSLGFGGHNASIILKKAE